MKNKLFIIAFLFLAIACGSKKEFSSNTENFEYLNSLFKKHQYFELKNNFELTKKSFSEFQQLVLSAKLNSVFNEKELSNSAIEKLFREYGKALSDSTKIELLEIEMNNHVLLFNYKESLESAQKITTFSSMLTADQIEDFENNKIIFTILEDIPPQTITIEESSLKITKDAAGLSRIPVKIGYTDQLSVFDTGANFSVITDSLAIKSGLTILEGTFKVIAITGNKIDANIAIADSLKLGNILLKNVVFLVFPEASLSFPQANYKIECIIGFPVIEALKEISIVKDSILYIPKNRSLYKKSNLALDFLTPVIEVIENDRSLPFIFDTGALETMLYSPYLKDYEETIKNGKLDSVHIGGAGGAKFIKIYHTPFTGKISGNEFHLKNTTVNAEDSPKDSHGIYGNLGKDVLNQFDTLTLNFEKMFLKLN